MRQKVIRVLGVAGLLPIFALVPTARTAGAASTVVPPKYYYLALGDSLAFGYQPNLDWSHGYYKYFYSDLQSHGATSVVNYGCNGETAATFINGGCPYQNIFMLHNYYTGPQLTAAVNFIKGHAGKVSPVTIDIGANDLKSYLNTSTCTVGNYSSALTTFNQNLQYILSKLAAALNGSGTILVMNYYNPYEVACPNSTYPAIAPVVNEFNSDIALDAAAIDGQNNTPIRTANVYNTFTGHICSYTWMCSSYNDIHANDTGYSLIAQQFETAYGY